MNNSPQPLPRRGTPSPATGGGGGISDIDDDLLQNILSKLPAKSFASSACVSRCWNHVCSRILCRPNFISAFSSNISLHDAVNEVLDKVLSEPIRPHFGILSINPIFNLDEAHELVVRKLGSGTPIVTCDCSGIIGRNAQTNEFAEVKFPYCDVVDDSLPACPAGISLTVGYLPGLKVDAIPLVDTLKGPSIDKFLMNLKDFSASVSGHTSPEAIIMFGELEADMQPVVENLDCVLSQQTVIAGNERCSFRHSSVDNNRAISTNPGQKLPYGAVALVFARDRATLDAGAGKVEFHFAVGSGISAVGPSYKVVSAIRRSREFTTWLTAKREGENEILDGEEMLGDCELEIEQPVTTFDLYIGVRKRRKYSIGSKQVKSMASVAYHQVKDSDEQYLYVGGWDIKTGDGFNFHIPDQTYALDSCATVSKNISKLKHKELIGGFVFACFGRGETFFKRLNVDSSPILDNFPEIPLAGMLCSGEIGRGSPNLGQSDDEEEAFGDSLLHVYSSVYLLMSYNPPTCRV